MLSGNSAEVTYSRECSKCAETCSDLGLSVSSTSSTAPVLSEEKHKPADLHFFSDTEATPGCRYKFVSIIFLFNKHIL
jgi:hypothetical protein